MKKWTIVCALTMSMALAGCVGLGEPRGEAYPTYAGTVDGIGMPMAQLNFFTNQALDMLFFWGGAMPDEFATEPVYLENLSPQDWMQTTVVEFDHMEYMALMEQAMEMAFDILAEFHLVVNRADEFGISLDDMDDADFERRIAIERLMIYDPPHRNFFETFGFTDETFRQFVEMRVLHDMVFEHIASLAQITEEELAQAFELFLEEEPEMAEAWDDNMEWLEDSFRSRHKWQLRIEYFEKRLEIWRNEAEIVRKIP